MSAGGTALSLSGLFLTTSVRPPTGTVISLASPAAVAAYFGSTSTEYAKSQTYFAGYTNCLAYPGAMLFAQYPTTTVAAYLRGGSLASLGLAGLQAITSGSLSVTIDGGVKSAASINLSTATTFSIAAGLIQTALGLSGSQTVTYDTVGGGFIITSGTTGASSTITFATGTLAPTLLLTAATGAVLSQGANAAASPSAFMTALVAVNQNWASFTHVFDPDNGVGNTNKLAFAAWNAAQNNRYLYVPWDTDATPTTTNPATSSLGYLVGPSGNNYSGTAPIYQPDITYNGPTFIMGYGASLNFNATNGRATAAFRTQSGLTAAVSSQTVAANLQANGYNWVGAYGNANSSSVFLYNGQVSGSFLWIDSYFNQIWLNYSLQAAIVNAFLTFPSFPYNPDGYSLIEAACAPVLQQFLNFGGARANVTLSAAEVASVNGAAGRIIAPTLSQQGYFLSVADPGAVARANRQTPVCVLWYVDGQSIQSIVVSSLLVQ